ncbi:MULTISPECIES: sulfur carrier protein ThiS [Lutispora]|uniref:Sulfur carrier protein ThiS n=1 Tax=Lutispora saccharofermentans TaxID=3024236 RepID=A0ABT1NDL6_9FIRM|nr:MULTISPECIES: sulfur carrier protein ThiS [Lutispora]MCQ1529241.1 sulfur carrier protein ThiS [Lutispora saccharofermentans]MEA4960906.1 sulfur carrier protein ThiS [Lutispora sp.]
MIRVNHRNMDFYEGMTLKSLIKDLKYSFPTLMVKVNGELVPKEKYEETRIRDGDDINIIHPIAGG